MDQAQRPPLAYWHITHSSVVTDNQIKTQILLQIDANRATRTLLIRQSFAFARYIDTNSFAHTFPTLNDLQLANSARLVPKDHPTEKLLMQSEAVKRFATATVSLFVKRTLHTCSRSLARRLQPN